jgi:hypothetical protein
VSDFFDVRGAVLRVKRWRAIRADLADRIRRTEVKIKAHRARVRSAALREVGG